jgi:hypothetical protein
MNPNFSLDMLKGFLRARVKITAFMTAFPNPPLTVVDLPKGEAAAKTALRRQAGVSAAEFDQAWHGRSISGVAQARLWRSLGVNPEAYGVRLAASSTKETADAA